MPFSFPATRRFGIPAGLFLVLFCLGVGNPAYGAAPYGYSQPVSHVTQTTARLNGSVVPNGTTTHAWFEWGTNASFNRITSSTNVGSGSALVYVSMTVTGLVAHQEYRYRLVTSNALGVVRGRVIPFATGYEITGWGTEYYGEITQSFSITNVTALAYGLALKTDGTVTAWAGDNSYGQTNVPPGVSNIIAVATGSGYSLVVRSNGTVTAWGKNDTGQTNVPAGLSNVVAISSGWYGHAFALKSDGRAVGWGYNAFGQASIPSICTNLIQIVGCAESSMALRADNTLIFWGDNAYGQLNAPNNMTNVVAIAAGYGHNMVLQADGTVRAWGWNSYGQTNVPAGLTNVIAIAAGYSQSLALLADGTVRAWGDNFYKQSTVSPALNGVVAVASQLFATYTLTKTSTGRPLTGTVAYTRPAAPVRENGARLDSLICPGGIGTAAWFEWGTNITYGQITTATNLGSGTNVIHFSAALTNLVFGGTYHCRVVASNSLGVFRGQDRLFCTAAMIGEWGAAGEIPVTGAQTGFVAVDTGVTHDLALKSDGTVIAWGDNSFSKVYVPPGLSNVATVGASQYSSFAIKDDGVGEFWGYTSYPIGLSNVINLQAAPYYSTVALFADGTLTVGNSYTNTNVVAFSCNSSLGIGLKIDGKVFSWGDSQEIPLDLGNVVDVACGSTHRLALRADGLVVGWGANTYGQLNIPPGLNNVRAISAGQYHSVAVKADGSIVSWGSVAHTNFPPGLSNVVAVETGANYNLYLYEPTRGASQCFTRVPAPLTTTNALLNGTVLPNGRATTAWFEWGNSLAYGNTSPLFDAGSWITNSQISFSITNLLAATVYHCRIVSSNEAGIAYGADQIFRTGSKVSAWGFFDYSQNIIPPGLSNTVSISSGWNSSCALKTDGTVIAWGRNEYGQTNIPASLSNVVAIASGYGHNLALKQDGTVAAWGWNGYGQGAVPPGLSDVVAIAAGDSHSLALKSDGSIVAWGWNTYGQTNQVAGLNNVVAIAAGATHNLALRPDGTVIVWGGNYNNQLSIPPGLSNVIAIAAGQSHSLALKRDGTVVAWGINNDNQISVPPGLSNVVSIAAAQWHSLAVRSDGSVVWWGRNNYGQTTPPADLEFCVGLAGGENHTLALANRPPVAIPQTVPALFNQDTVLKLIGTDANADQLSFKISSLPAAGSLYQFTTNGRGVAMTSPNTVVTDGSGRVIFAPETNAVAMPYTSFSFVANDGDSDSTPAFASIGIAILKPYAITQPTTPLGDTAIAFHGVVTPNNSPTTAWFEWGETSSYGEITAPLDVGTGVAPVRLNVAAGSLAASANFHGRLVASNSIGLAVGADFIFTTGEKVSAWGGFGDSVLKIPPGLSNTVALVAGDWHALALKANGTVTAWGTSPNGQTNTPADLSNVIAIASSQLHNLALRSDGTVVGWGLNQSGQATPPAGLSNAIAIAAGISNSFALKADGGVVSWGQNVFGETDVPPGLNGVVAIACGRHHVIALRHDGSLVTWGNSDYGQTNIPPAATNIIAISAGDYHSLALRSDGKVIAWGANDSQQSTVPASLSNVVAIAGCGYYLNLALKSDGTMATWGSFTPLPTWTNVAGIAGEGAHNLALVNLPPVATPKIVSVPANFDSVITLSGTDTNTDLLSFKTVTLPAVGALYQFTTNGRGSPILAPDTPVNDSLGRIWFAPETNQFGNAYASFNFVANDGDADSAPAQIQINVIATKPLAYTQASTPLATNNAQIHGMIFSGNLPAVGWFEWGTNSSSEQSSTPQSFPLNSGVTRLSATLSNLTPLVVYRYRIAASNALGVSYGIEQRFTTGQRVTAWGQTLYGQTTIPASLSNVVSIAGGVNQSCALVADGKAYSWGFHSTSNLVASNLTAVALGTDFGLGISNGTVIAWGYYQYQLPTPPAGLSNIIAIATGDFIGLALRSDGKVFMWGFGEFGQTTVPASATNVVAISSSRAHCLALRADGQVVGWGRNESGQASPPSALSNVVMVAAGGSHSLALRSNGAVFAWGQNSFGQINVPASATNVIAVAAGDSHSLALRTDGSVVVWGNTAYGQTIIPAGLSNVVSIAAGAAQSLAIGNVKPTVLPRAFSGAANSDLLVTLSGSDTNSDVLTYRLANLPAAGKLYQYAGGTRGALMMDGDTVSDLQRRLIFAPNANANGSPYTNFNYFANDGQINSATSTVTLTIAAPIRPMITEITRTNNTSTRLTFTGHSNTTYCVWASTNLEMWEYLGLPTPSIAGTFQFLDSTPAHFAQRFYRISTGCETPPPQSQSSSAMTGGGFDLRFGGGAYWTYRVWASTNLVYWEPIGTAVESQPGVFRFTDTAATNSPQRFYKAGAP